MSTLTPLQEQAPRRELSATEKALVQALVNAIVRELNAERTTTEAA